MEKLDMQHKHVLNLIARDRNSEGWASVSETVYPHVSQNIPTELVEFEKLDRGGRARLTTEGQKVVDAMKWL